MPEFNDLKPCKKSSVSTFAFLGIDCMSFPCLRLTTGSKGLSCSAGRPSFSGKESRKGK